MAEIILFIAVGILMVATLMFAVDVYACLNGVCWLSGNAHGMIISFLVGMVIWLVLLFKK